METYLSQFPRVSAKIDKVDIDKIRAVDDGESLVFERHVRRANVDGLFQFAFLYTVEE